MAPGLTTWGEWLDSLETGPEMNTPDRSIVTAVRFQGVDQPSFRDAGSLALPVSAISPVYVELSTARDLLAEAAAAVRNGL